MMRTDGLREIVETLDREMTRLQGHTGTNGPETAALLTAWAELVEYLALGPAPELRACPHCGAMGMRAATRCGVCWRRLQPPAAAGRA